MPAFLKGLLGYRSIAHLNDVVAPSLHQTQPTEPKQIKQGSAPPRFLPSSTTGLPKGTGAPNAHLREGWQQAARAHGNFGARKLTYSHTHSPPCSGAAQAVNGHTPALPAAPRLTAQSTALYFLASYPNAFLIRNRLFDAGTRLKRTEAAAARRCEPTGSVRSGRPPSRAALPRSARREPPGSARRGAPPARSSAARSRGAGRFPPAGARLCAPPAAQAWPAACPRPARSSGRGAFRVCGSHRGGRGSRSRPSAPP